MKLPRNLTGNEFATLLRREFGYEVARQRGSHLRLTTQVCGTHSVTVPEHDPIRVGTLSGILADVADHHGLSKDAPCLRLFGK